jgi:hypothetical protein
MKARTASAKRKAKRGRPCLTAIARENSGRKSRRKESQIVHNAMTEADAKSVVVKRRIREDNIVPFREKGGKVVTAEAQAEDPRRGYVLGLMRLDHTITERQHEAGIRFSKDIARYYGLAGIPHPSPRAQDLFRVGGSDGEESATKADRAKRARTKHNALRDHLLATGNINEGRHILHSVKEVCVMDNLHARRWPEHMLMFVRRGLNRLADYYGIETS